MNKYILEVVLTLVFLVCGLLLTNPTFFVASGLFAIATQIGLLRSDKNAT